MKAQLLLPFALFMVFFTSCQKEETNNALSTTVEITPEVYLSSLQETVLFQFDRQDLSTGGHTGWFVDKSGNLKTYTLSEEIGSRLTENGECTVSDLSQLTQGANASAINLSRVELADYVKMSRQMNNQTLSEKTEDENEGIVTSVLAFRLISNYQGNTEEGCTEDENHEIIYDDEQTYRVLTLSVEGAITQKNTHGDAPELINWLKSLESQLEL